MKKALNFKAFFIGYLKTFLSVKLKSNNLLIYKELKEKATQKSTRIQSDLPKGGFFIGQNFIVYFI